MYVKRIAENGDINIIDVGNNIGLKCKTIESYKSDGELINQIDIDSRFNSVLITDGSGNIIHTVYSK